jgi:hypothetical protein
LACQVVVNFCFITNPRNTNDGVLFSCRRLPEEGFQNIHNQFHAAHEEKVAGAAEYIYAVGVATFIPFQV